MTILNKRRALCIALVASLMMGCGARDETDRANTLVDDGNAEVETAKKQAGEGMAKYTQAFDFDADTDTSADWEKSKPTAKEASDLLEKAASSFDRAADKFAQAGKLNVDPKFKQYLDLKARGFRLRAEQFRITRELPQSLLDASITDGETLVSKINENDSRAQKIAEESEKLEADAEKIRQENTGLFETR